MQHAATVWLERGFAQIEPFAPLDFDGRFMVRQFVTLLPVTTALARLWGSVEPARANGAASALLNPLLSATARAAAMEFVPWPLPAVASALRRAERDYLAAAARRFLTDTQQLDVCDGFALAWARWQPAELPAVYARLHAQVRPAESVGVWAAQVCRRAERRLLLPEAGLRPPGGPAEWRRLAGWGLTSASRMRACLALAAHELQTTPAGG